MMLFRHNRDEVDLDADVTAKLTDFGCGAYDPPLFGYEQKRRDKASLPHPAAVA